MKIFSQRWAVNTLLLTAILILTIAGFLGYKQIQRWSAANASVIHTYQVIGKANQILLALVDSESQLTTYIVSDKKTFLSSPASIDEEVMMSLNELKTLTKDNPAQQKKIAQLEPLVKEKLRTRQIILATYAKNKNKGIGIVLGDQRQQVRKQIFEIVSQINAEEYRLLNIRNGVLAQDTHETNIRLMMISISTELLLLLSLVLLNYQLIRREKTEGLLLESNKRLKESENRFILATEGSNAGLWDWVPGTNHVFFSKHFKKMLGYSPEEFPDALESFEKAIHPDDHDELWKKVTQHLENHVPFMVEYRLMTKSGGYNWYQAAGQALWDENGKPIRMAGSIIDIAERKKIEKLKNEFVSVVSHELRTPLTSIRGSLGLVLGGTVGDFSEKVKKLLEIANNNCERLLLLINDILDIEKIEAGRMVFQNKKLDINKIVQESVAANKLYGEKYNVQIQIKKTVEGLTVNADPDRLMQVLANLISNAVKFSTHNGVVSVSITQHENLVRVSVTNKGVGISEDFQKRIFQKFSQADSSDSRAKGGTGLGLNISKTLMEKMGGTLNFHSKVNDETTFYFDLPLHQKEQKFEIAAPSSAKKRLLLCEDDEDQAKYLSELLKTAHYEVDVAENVRQAKYFLVRNKYHALLLDLILPDQDGITFVRELRSAEVTCNLPIIVISIIADTGRAILSGEAFSVLDWLDKPINFEKLIKIITSIKSESCMRILYVEDDPESQNYVKTLLEDKANIVIAGSIAEAQKELEKSSFDLIILDLLLPDGNGATLLPIFSKNKIPVIVYSSMELDKEYAKLVSQSLVKSKTSNDELLISIKNILEMHGGNHCAEGP